VTLPVCPDIHPATYREDTQMKTRTIYKAWTQDHFHCGRTFSNEACARQWVEREAPSHCHWGFVQSLAPYRKANRHGPILVYRAETKLWS
jgi:hypothetical protein